MDILNHLLLQWDVLSSGNPVNAVACIPTGTDPGNCISIIQVTTLSILRLDVEECSQFHLNVLRAIYASLDQSNPT